MIGGLVTSDTGGEAKEHRRQEIEVVHGVGLLKRVPAKPLAELRFLLIQTRILSLCFARVHYCSVSTLYGMDRPRHRTPGGYDASSTHHIPPYPPGYTTNSSATILAKEHGWP